ncbi:MAG: NAD(P)-binding domain-containing protein [Acidobacteriota bacterium]|nr:NAD(P)-binding domain-containing protein [Acidobacteriota bacterium]MDQ5835235.1 NAD(P)-binding domain-containing protein [Acidobacteriota bacterium]
MKIGIIGAGMIGGTLARRLTALGHEVVIANSRGPETLRELAAETGARAVTAAAAARRGEIVIVTIPQRAVPNLPTDLFAGVPEDVVVVDTGNYYPARDGRIDAIEDGQVESAWVAEHLGRPVVKAFNNIVSQSLLENGRPEGAPGRIALPVSGDPPGARQKVMRLVDELGFDPVDAGNLENSWRQQPGTPCYAADLGAPRLKEALAAADRSLVPEYRRKADDAARAFFAQGSQRQ